LFANTHEDEPMATPQMSMKKGLKVFGKDGVEAVKKEMLQLHDRKVMEPKHATELTHAQKQEALASVPDVLEKKALWESQGTRMRRQPETTLIHWSRRRGTPRSCDRVGFPDNRDGCT
jgi:hypothetical protein